MSDNPQASLQEELERLKRQVSHLESEIARGPSETIGTGTVPTRFYTAYYATTGFLLGGFGAVTSLLFNVVGSLIVGQNPLQLIQVYLTFPLGERALHLNDGLTLAIGCCLYLGTGMLLGVGFQIALAWYGKDSLPQRLAVASVLGIAIWLVNYYGVLSWLQPLLFKGSWIIEQIPVWVAALTHLIFAWTMAIVYPLGVYTPYRSQSEQA